MAGFALAYFFESAYSRGHKIRGSVKVLIILGAAFLLAAAETLLANYVAVSGLFAVVSMAGVLISLAGTELSLKERIFCVIAYLPKATVQAAIGSVPLAMGLPCGNIVLSVAVLAIIITAPLGALGMDAAFRRLLTKSAK